MTIVPFRILFLSPHFHPERISTGKYNTLVVKGLLERGAEVQVVTSHPLYPAWKPTPSKEPYLNASVRRGGGWMRYPSKPILRRLALELWFSCHCVWRLWHRRKHVDLAVFVFPPSLYALLVGLLLPQSTRKIGIVHDLQAVMGLGGKRKPRRALNWLVRSIEKRAFQACTELIALSDQMARTLTESYSESPSKVTVCYPFRTLVDSRETSRNLIHILKDGAVHVVYSGAMGEKQNSRKLFEFFGEAAKEMPTVRFHLFSGGRNFDEYRLLCASEGINGVQLHELVDEADLAELYARSAVQVVPQLHSQSNGCFPSKLPNILAAGCAVLAICDPHSDLAEIINQTQVGAVAVSWETAELITKLRQVLEQAAVQTREERKSGVSGILDERFNLERLLDVILGSTPGNHKYGDPTAMVSAAK